MIQFDPCYLFSFSVRKLIFKRMRHLYIIKKKTVSLRNGHAYLDVPSFQRFYLIAVTTLLLSGECLMILSKAGMATSWLLS